MATMYDPYKNNANITERRETAPKPQTSETPVKNTLDNSGSVLYNKDRRKSGFKPPSLLTDTLQRWKEKNKGTLRYAGDSAKKSIDA